jgi:uncharacterized membrane protein
VTQLPPAVLPFLPWLFLHIATGCIAILTGYVAVLAAKGGKLHRRAGTVFVAAMIATTSVALYLSFSLRGQLPGQVPNIAGGMLAFYLVLSAYMTVRRPQGAIGPFERLSFLIPLCIGAVFFYWGFVARADPKRIFDGYHPIMFFIIGGVCLFFAALDLKVLAQGRLTGAARISRHIWRMCYAFFFASASIFLGNRKVVPPALHGSKILLILGFAPLAFLLFWMIRVRIGNRFKDPLA